MFQFAVLLACQMPFKFGVPSRRRGIVTAGDWARVSAVGIANEAIAAADTAASSTPLELFQLFIGHYSSVAR
jgi:hypothetical protein